MQSLELLPTVSRTALDRIPSAVVKRALAFARERLSGEWRQSSGEAAIEHALRVAMRLRDSFGVSDGETVAIALLHDVLEDTSTGYGEVRREFGSRVADAVLLLTKPKLGRKRDRCVYQNALADAGEELQLVKLADYLDNMRTRKSRARCETTAKKARQFLRKLEKRRLAPRVRHAARIVAEEIAEILPEDC